jgi:long-chain acyl-CoA synthetase
VIYNLVVTLYSTLTEEAVAHGLNETGCEFVLTSHELLPKFKSVLETVPSVKHLIYMEDPIKITEVKGYKQGVNIYPFNDIVKKGSKSKIGEL